MADKTLQDSPGDEPILRALSARQRVFDRFVLQRVLGRGGMGVVWLAHDEGLHLDVALKFVPEAVRMDPSAVDDLKHETRHSFNLTHPNIVRIYDFFEDEEHAAISMELVNGETVAKLRSEKPHKIFLPEEMEPWLGQLCAALDYAHLIAKVVHRDIKPANLMLSAKGELKMTDFGIARSISDSITRVTARAGISGTPPYMSPQQLNGEISRPTDDIYSLGAMLYELLARRPPFYSGDVAHQAREIVPTPIARRRKELEIEAPPVPAPWEQTIMACLAKDAAQRPQSAGEVWRRLQLQKVEEIPAAADKILGPNPKRTKSRLPALVVAAAAVVLLALAGWYFWVHSSKSKQAQEPPISSNQPPPASAEANVAPTPQPMVPPKKYPQANQRWTNILGQIFVPVPGTAVLFCIWDTRVQDYHAYVESGFHRELPKPDFEQGPTHPVVNVSWEDAQSFCSWLSQQEHQIGRLRPEQRYRLPTDEEWSTAVGLEKEPGTTPAEKNGKVKDVYPWGKQWPPPAGAGNYNPLLDVDNYMYTSPAGSFAANAYGLFDMGGNVWQWCVDWSDSGQKSRVLRGASWAFNDPADLLSASRAWNPPDDRNDNSGFRCVLVDGVVRQNEASITAEHDAQAPERKAVSNSASPNPPTRPTDSQRWTNSLGQIFVPVPGTAVLFCIWDTRVQDFEKFVNDTGYDATVGMYSLGSDDWKQRGDTWKHPGFEQRPTHPVCGVSWDDATNFCHWLTEKERTAGVLTGNQVYRLPTDKEWSAAVGAQTYPWGETWPPPAGAGNYAGSEAVDANWPSNYQTIADYRDGYARTSPVGSFAANTYGLFDMGGNVCQWCDDWYRKEMNTNEVRLKYLGLDNDGGGQTYRALRGASWMNGDPVFLSSACRGKEIPGGRGVSVGFRCVLLVGGVVR